MNAVLLGDRARVLGFSEVEKPLALQLGGDDPVRLAECARIAEDWGYDEVNLNVGCPSARVRSGNFGACLMAQPERVAACVAAMKRAVAIPVTVKHRVGIDDLDLYDDMRRFVSIVADAGAERFTVHARKAWLSGLSPKENRTVPPLRYDDVYRLKREFSELTHRDQRRRRESGSGASAPHPRRRGHDRARSLRNPLRPCERRTGIFMGEDHVPTRGEVVTALLPYLEAQLAGGVPLKSMTRHILGLFNGQPGARACRRYSERRGSPRGRGRRGRDGSAAADSRNCAAGSGPVQLGYAVL